MNTNTQPTPTAAAPAPVVRTPEQGARSFALDRAHALTLDLARHLRTACEADQTKPLNQKSRADLKKATETKLAEIERQIGRVLE